MAPLLKYTVLRLALFVAALGLLAVLGARPLLALIGAALISMLLSYVLLRRPREELSEQISQRMDRRRQRGRWSAATREDAAIEDAADEARRGAAPPKGDGPQ